MRSHRHISKSLSIVLAAGIATTVHASPDSKPHEPDQQRTYQSDAMQHHGDRLTQDKPRDAEHSLIRFRTASDLLAADVQNERGDTVASVEDFIFERGSGQIEYAVLSTGAILGMGGKTVAVPYDKLQYNVIDKAFVTGMTADQIENTSSFVPQNWNDLDRSAWTGGTDWIDELFGADEQVPDTWAEAVRGAEKQQFKGEIISVRRDGWVEGTENVTLVINDGGSTRTVLVGPAWYVTGLDDAPEQGDTIDAEVAVLATDAGTRYVLVSSTIDNRTMRYRTASGEGRWTSITSADYDTPPRRLVLMSSLLGAKAEARGQDEAGEIQDAVVETESGRVALVGFDPNENFLGLGDEILAVPWSLVNLTGNDEVRLTAGRTLIERGVTMPDAAADFERPLKLRRAYQPFGLEPKQFRNDRMKKSADEG